MTAKRLIINQLVQDVQEKAIDIIMQEWPSEEGHQEWNFIHAPEVVSSVVQSEWRTIQEQVEQGATNSVLEHLQHTRSGFAPEKRLGKMYHCLKKNMLNTLEHELWQVNLHMQNAVQEFGVGLNRASGEELRAFKEHTFTQQSDSNRASGEELCALKEHTFTQQSDSAISSPRMDARDTSPVVSSHLGRQIAEQTTVSTFCTGRSDRFSVDHGRQDIASMVRHINVEHLQDHSFGSIIDSVPGPLGDVLKWVASQEEPEREGICARIVTSKRFETLCLLVIVANVFFTCYETNAAMREETLQKAWNLQAVETFFTVFYTLEILAKLWIHRFCFFFCGDVRWNLFDFFLVAFALIDLALEQVMRSPAMTNTVFMRLLRLLRTAKIFRIIRLLRFFSELRLIMTCIIGSAGSLFWSVVMLTGFSLIVSIVLVQRLTIFLVEKSQTVDADTKDNIGKYFGSVQTATLSLFKAMGGGNDWDLYVKELEKTGAFNAMVFMGFMLFVWLSMANIITSLYVEKALKAAQPDVEELLFSKHKEDLAAATELRMIFNKIDANNSGTLSFEEFEECMADFNVCAYFEMRGLAIKDAEMFFKMLIAISEIDEVDIGSFVGGCLKMKGVAMNIDLVMLHYEVKLMHRALRKQFDAVRKDLKTLMNEIDGRIFHGATMN